MPYLHCNECHHEWEGGENSKCDWCGAGSFVLEDETPLERFARKLLKNQVDMPPEFAKMVDDNFFKLTKGRKDD